ncbi:MAG: hypothetical protein ACUVXA_11495 [Candidatus Jordarchaeum sp.]|uniref:hypothetical protein n=1 Tax=Candidatus Jordarchaeum sp. TaxID=2823881 RepID=UPI00404B5CFC
MSSEDNSVVFEPFSRKASISGSSYLVQIGKVDDYWSIAIFRGKDLVAVKKVGTLDPNVLTSVIGSSISLPLISPYSIARSLGNIISEAKVRKYPIGATPPPGEGPQPPTPAYGPAPTPAPIPEESTSISRSDFESTTGFKRISMPEDSYQEEISPVEEPVQELIEPVGEERFREKELPEAESSEEMLGEFATGPSTAFRSMFEAEEAPVEPVTREAAAPSIKIADLSPLEKWQKGVSGLSFFLDIAISYMKKKYSKDLSKLWDYYRDIETKNWKAAKDMKFTEIVKTLVNIDRAMGSEINIQEFTENTFKAKITKCLSRNYKEKYKSALDLPDEFPCILCRIRGEAISRNLGYYFNIIETSEGCQIELASSAKKERLII